MIGRSPEDGHDDQRAGLRRHHDVAVVPYQGRGEVGRIALTVALRGHDAADVMAAGHGLDLR